MANTRMYQFMYSKVPMLSMIQGTATFGASGAVSSFDGIGVANFTKNTVGLYTIQLVDNWNKVVQGSFLMESGVTGSNVADGSFVANTAYQIVTPGTTNWSAIGLPAGFTAATGMPFVATGVGGAGTGTAKAIAASGIVCVEMIRGVDTLIAPVGTPNLGANFIIQMLDKTDALASPASGSKLRFSIMLSNSSSKY